MVFIKPLSGLVFMWLVVKLILNKANHKYVNMLMTQMFKLMYNWITINKLTVLKLKSTGIITSAPQKVVAYLNKLLYE